MEQYPDGGYFDGKNFVFDHRLVLNFVLEPSNYFIVTQLLNLFQYGLTESLWEAIKITYLELVWYVDLPMMTIPLGVVAAIAECWS